MSSSYKRKHGNYSDNRGDSRPPLDPNTSFATKTALAFKNAYASQKPSVLLDMFIYFRDNDQSITYKATSSALLNMTSDIFASIGSNIAGLPKELNPEAIDKILAYIHGDALIFPKPLNDKDVIHKTFIAAVYFKQTKLADKLKNYAVDQLSMTLDWADMENFVRNLPPPLFLHQFPSHIDQLPSMSGAPQAPPSMQPPAPAQNTWRQQAAAPAAYAAPQQQPNYGAPQQQPTYGAAQHSAGYGQQQQQGYGGRGW